MTTTATAPLVHSDTAEKFIARQVKAGASLEVSRAALARILRDHSGHNLAFALVHEGFATERQAYAFLGSIPHPLNWTDMGSSAKDLWEDRYMRDLAHRVAQPAGGAE